MKSLVFNLLKIIVFLLLPFIGLIRMAVFLHEHYNWFPWFSIIGGIIASALILFVYINYIRGRVIGRAGSFRSLKVGYWLSLSLVLVYCLPAVFYLSAGNAKYPKVQKEFRSLHPVLRLSISTLIVLEKDLILTDASRRPEDYRKMGLKSKQHSLHYKQKNGYVHAVDIRTKGHSGIRNGLVRLYFKMMGFNTLRHHGTEDHLHISLMSHDRPGGI